MINLDGGAGPPCGTLTVGSMFENTWLGMCKGKDSQGIVKYTPQSDLQPNSSTSYTLPMAAKVTSALNSYA